MKQFECIFDKVMVAIDESKKQQFNHLPMVYYEDKLWVDAKKWIESECAPLRVTDVDLRNKEWVEVDGESTCIDSPNPILTVKIANDSWTPEMASVFSQVFGNYEVQAYEIWDVYDGPTGLYALKVLTKLSYQ